MQSLRISCQSIDCIYPPCSDRNSYTGYLPLPLPGRQFRGHYLQGRPIRWQRFLPEKAGGYTCQILVSHSFTSEDLGDSPHFRALAPWVLEGQRSHSSRGQSSVRHFHTSPWRECGSVPLLGLEPLVASLPAARDGVGRCRMSKEPPGAARQLPFSCKHSQCGGPWRHGARLRRW